MSIPILCCNIIIAIDTCNDFPYLMASKKTNSTEPMYHKEQIAELVGMEYHGRALDTKLYNLRKEMVEGVHYVRLNKRQIMYTRKGLTLAKKVWKESEENRQTYTPKNPRRAKS